MNFSNKLCLLCLENHDNTLDINGKQGIHLNIGTILQEHFWFDIDTLAARHICQNCWKNVESFHSFYNFVKSIHQQQVSETKRTIDNGLVFSIKEEPIEIKDVVDILPDVSNTSDAPAPRAEDLEVESIGNNDHQPPLTVKQNTRKFKRKKSGMPPAANRLNKDAHASILSQYFNMACDLCDTLLPSYKETKKHYKDVHNRPGYLICCNRKYDRLPNMLSHCEWHMNPSAFNCNQCPMTFREKYGLHQHCRESHAAETEKRLKCDYCDEKFSMIKCLRKHLKSRHDQSFKCPICQKCFTGKVSVRFHIRDDHSLEDEREYRRNLKRLTKVEVKEDDKSFQCDICGSRFVLLSHIRSHIKRVHTRRNFGRKVDIHSEICEICAKPFKTRWDREKHYISAHTNNGEKKVEKKVQCDICGKWLKHKYTLSGHMLLHKSKPVSCKICGNVLSTQRALQRHMQRVHREPWMECVVCGKKFKTKLVLKEHMAIHAGITDLYSCTFCPKTFRSSANLYSHRKRAHPAELEKMRKN